VDNPRHRIGNFKKSAVAAQRTVEGSDLYGSHVAAVAR
jgi:hypothetical protein